jgi:hypothetical protein
LIDIAASRVNWDRTTRYAASAARHTLSPDPGRKRLRGAVERRRRHVERRHAVRRSRQAAGLVERARKTLAEWPLTHYNYRANEVRQMLTMLDEAIADLRAAATPGRYELTLSAFVDPPTITEPLLPAPSVKESIEQTLAAAHTVDAAADRSALLGAALATNRARERSAAGRLGRQDARGDGAGDPDRAARRPRVSAAHEALCPAGQSERAVG